MAARRIAFVPTTLSRRLAQRLYIDARGLTGAGATAEGAQNEAWPASMRQTIQQAGKAGVSIVLGSDFYYRVPGLNRGEGALEGLFGLGEVGLSPFEGLRAATSNAAEAIEPGQKTGQIRAGFQANLIAVAGNPLEGLQVLRHI